MKNIFKLISLGLLACFVSNTAVAEDAGWYDSGWYIGGSLGRSMANIDDSEIRSQLISTGASSVSIDDDDIDTGFKLFGGYQFSQYSAFEFGYFDLGQFGYTATTVPAGTLTGEAKMKGLNLDLVGMFPFSQRISALGRFGFNYTKTEDEFSNTGVVPVPANASPDETAMNYKMGFGLQININQNLALRAESERYRIDDAVNNNADIDMMSLGLVLRFDNKKTYPAESKNERKVVVPVVMKSGEYCGVLDIEFDIKQNEVRVGDTEKLLSLATFMKKYPNTTAVIEGHADDVGEADFNMKLSQQRADSVVDYLVKEQRINASRLKAVGYGENNPQSNNDSSKGQQSNRRINAVIACVDDIEGLKVKPTRITMALELEFDPYKHEIKSKYRKGLEAVAKYLKANPEVVAIIEGHADRVVGTGGDRQKVSAKTSMKISQDRAKAVVDYLVKAQGIQRSRLSTTSYGQTERVTYSTTLDEQQENRRVNIILIYPKK